jgi:hypothetical protein
VSTNCNPSEITFANSSSSSNSVSATLTAPSFFVEEYGPLITIDAARQLISNNLSLPTYLPDDLQLKEIRGGENLVYLIFSSPTLPAIPSWDNGSLLMSIARDNTTYTNFTPSSEVAVTQSCSTRLAPPVTVTCTNMTNTMSPEPTTSRTDVSVSGYLGWGSDPVAATGQTGFLTWWNSDNGLHYAISADLPLSTLVSVGRSTTSN